MNKEILNFSKYHGTGNDFILIDENSISDIELNKQQIAFLCDRHFGIGADGLIIIRSSDDYDFEMKYFNSNGSEGTMCGNGGRCAVAFALHKNIIKTGRQVRFLASDGPHNANISQHSGNKATVELEMSDSMFPIRTMSGYFINTGSPHLVIQTENIHDADVFSEGKKLRYNREFLPDGVNVNYIAPTETGIFVRTYERGVEDETLSCGTGVTAAAIVWSFMNKKTGRQTMHVETRGGILEVTFTRTDENYSEIILKGSATHVFEGQIEIPETL